MSKLTVKQQKFADEYIISGNATQSAIKAGYAKKAAYATGAENLKKPQIKKYIDQRLEQLKKESIAEQDELLQYLTSIVRGKQTEQTLVGEGMGEQSIKDIEVSAKDRIKAAELLGKRYGMWVDKQQVEVTEVPTFIDDISGEDDG